MRKLRLIKSGMWITCWSLILVGAMGLGSGLAQAEVSQPTGQLPTGQSSTGQPSIGQITTATGQVLTSEQVWEALAKAQVIYLGETHDSKADHIAQLKILQTLHLQNLKLAIGLEMFQRPYQSVLDDYLADRITEAELVKKTEYQKRWGFDWELYAPIVRFAKANKIPIVALNTPVEVTRKISRQGLLSLNLNDKRFIPPISELEVGVKTSAPDYRQMLRDIFTQVHQGKGGQERFERFFTAQVVWDETMADRIVHSLQKFPDRQILVLAGQGHIVYGHGIPSRVQRRQPQVRQKLILLNPDPSEQKLTPQSSQPRLNQAKPNPIQPEAKIADFLWTTE